ncbi:hypothetical protein WJU23_10870 [Prosthecobacter sp. SYSU 5D2]|uniref:hypothetical protein n=1 Tax=Prosthecobacter sp. SYSU 5D2 TaxID=3134134 RepID=UPI0031FF0701
MDKDALLATSLAFSSMALVTLTAPSQNRILSWIQLRAYIKKLKDTLSNWHRRKGFPALLFVTEFDPPHREEIGAHFHIGLASPLDETQISAFRRLWLDLVEAQNNMGNLFDYSASGGGKGLQLYLAKDVVLKEKAFVKYPAPWLPERVKPRLWFCIGIKRRPSKEGAKIRSRQGKRRRRFDDFPWHRSQAREGVAQATLTVSTHAHT